jgi:hypothetical protein
MHYTWTKWLKAWRTIADKSSPNEYIPITITADDMDFEVLRVSKFHKEYDGNKPYVETPIREFNDKTALHSRATRDLGIMRVITNNHKPAFVIEPGADVLDWIALTQGVAVKSLVEMMRTGDLGRRVRRRDRKALKDSRSQALAVHQELSEELDELRAREKKLEKQLNVIQAELDDAITARNRMKENLIKQNKEQCCTKSVPVGSGTEACSLGTLMESGYKLTSCKPMPGSFEG